MRLFIKMHSSVSTEAGTLRTVLQFLYTQLRKNVRRNIDKPAVRSSSSLSTLNHTSGASHSTHLNSTGKVVRKNYEEIPVYWQAVI
jgi:hypothetical protein